MLKHPGSMGGKIAEGRRSQSGSCLLISNWSSYPARLPRLPGRIRFEAGKVGSVTPERTGWACVEFPAEESTFQSQRKKNGLFLFPFLAAVPLMIHTN